MTIEKRLKQIEDQALQNSDSTSCVTAFAVSALCEVARQLDRIAVQLEKITSLKYTEDPPDTATLSNASLAERRATEDA